MSKSVILMAAAFFAAANAASSAPLSPTRDAQDYGQIAAQNGGDPFRDTPAPSHPGEPSVEIYQGKEPRPLPAPDRQ
jgi:hypothetical protein